MLDGESVLSGGTVIVDEELPQNTGLLDASGAPLYRVPGRQPAGFDLKPKERVMAKKKPMPGKKKGC